MKAEIEKIIHSDEAVQKKVEAAKIEARDILAGAQQQAEEIIAQKENELAALRKEELESILSEARTKAQGVLEETDRYLERLRDKKEEHLEGLMNDLLKEVIGS